MGVVPWVVFSIFVSIAEGFCGFPGEPENANFLIFYDSSVQIADYNCHSEVIDGNVTRKCQHGKWTGNAVRCATDVVNHDIKVSGNAGNARDRNLDTCHWIHSGDVLTFEFKEILLLHAVTVIAPVPYKDALKSSQLKLQIVNGGKKSEQLTGTFRETETALASDQFSSLRWITNTFCGSVVLSFVSDVYLCEIVIHMYPDKCGEPEIPIHGHVNYTKSQAIYYCDPGFKLLGSAERNCSQGLWTGEQPTCVLSHHFCNCPLESENDSADALLNTGPKQTTRWSTFIVLVICSLSFQ